MTAPLLELKGIGKSFSGQPVLNAVDFSLRAGEIHVLAGENGAGKSTLMRVLCGVYQDYEGELLLNGVKERFKSPQDAARKGISIIHQELSLIPSMTVSDNIFLARETDLRWGWLRFSSERKRCIRILSRLGVKAQAQDRVDTYPIGVQQSIEVAKALAFDARILVMDEPTSALTEPEVDRLFAVMEDLKKDGCGIIYITHKMEEIYRVADRITVLRDGHYIGTADREDLSREQLIHWMVGREVSESARREKPSLGETVLDIRRFTVPDPGGRPRPAVDRVSFSLHAGEIVGLAGLQGSGADVLLNALYGSYGSCTTGELYVEGRAYTPRSPKHALDRGIALLCGDRKREGLVLPMSITHNISLAALARFSPRGLLREDREQRAAEESRSHFGIRVASLDHPVETLSGGNQQKVVLAKCLQTQPRILLLNEPTRGVDVGAKQEIYALLNRWTAQGIAILLISTEMPELLALSDRIIALHRGHMTATFQGSDVSAETVLAASMGGLEKSKS
ncbi:MAG: sugar ABC transporter ATP-binding protein [Candidatus Hydrogenedentes bacterium]|jgi:ribose transport system ATP-binding protein|nr:sugar ABC transporter ATP-binding protein [Candidatus Hydrogenedentota bacterium]